MSSVRGRRSYVFYDTATSVCSTCLFRVEAKLLIEDERVILEKWCPDHGRERVLVADDVAYWRWARERFLVPADVPHRFQTPTRWGCPYDCGLCPDHQQHACLTVLEVNDVCNLTCPVCYAESGVHRTESRSPAEVERMLDAVVAAEKEPDVVQISGGEPTIHPDFFAILDLAKQRPIRHLMVNTNGVRIAREPSFAKRLAAYKPGFELYLQFDSLRDEALRTIRGARLSEVRRRALENLEEAGVPTTLVVTLQHGVNDDEIGAILEHALSWSCVRGVTFQPIQEAGRTQGYDPRAHRLTLTEVRRRILEQFPPLSAADLLPVPCHPDALCMAYGLRVGARFVPLSGMIDVDTLLKGAENTVAFERVPALRQAFLGLFSAGAGPDQQRARPGELLCCLPQFEVPGSITYDHVFRVAIMRFHDVRDFDLRSVKRSCVHFVSPDGEIIPFDTYNLFYRGDRRAQLEALRRRVDQR
jgi:hypothetical protein